MRYLRRVSISLVVTYLLLKIIVVVKAVVQGSTHLVVTKKKNLLTEIASNIKRIHKAGTARPILKWEGLIQALKCEGGGRGGITACREIFVLLSGYQCI